MINTLDFTGANVGMVYSSKGWQRLSCRALWGSLLINGCALSEPICFAIWFARGVIVRHHCYRSPDDVLGDVGECDGVYANDCIIQ